MSTISFFFFISVAFVYIADPDGNVCGIGGSMFLVAVFTYASLVTSFNTIFY